MVAIDVQNIVKKFGDFTAVKGITFGVEAGEIFGLLGPNGAGKSTLIRMLTTLLPPTAGTAVINGFDVVKQADGVRHSIGVIPQAMTSDLELSVEENLIIFAKLYGVPREKRKRLIDELLDAVELTQWRDKQVKNLSGGMRRRVEIARGLVHEPRIFFLDEPTTGLDPVSRVHVWEMLQRIKAERELTVLITTHYMDEADKLCDRIAIVDHGELKALDSPMKLKASVPGKNMLEASFSDAPDGWEQTLATLPAVEDVTSHDNIFRLASSNGPATTMALMEAAGRVGHHGQFAGGPEHDARRRVRALHRTRASRRPAGSLGGGQSLHDSAGIAMQRTLAIIEREMRRFRRSPMLHRHVDDLSDRAAGRARLRLWRQRQAPEGRGRRSGSRRAGGESPRAGERRVRRQSDVRHPRLHGSRCGAHRPAERPRQRRADHSAGFLAAGAQPRISPRSR